MRSCERSSGSSALLVALPEMTVQIDVRALIKIAQSSSHFEA